MSEPTGVGLRSYEHGGIAVLELVGEHMIERAGELQAALSDALEHGRLAVDLSAATLLDSAALAALLTAAERIAFRGGEMVVVVAEETPQVVRRALRIAGVDGAVLTFPTLDAALAHLERFGDAKPG